MPSKVFYGSPRQARLEAKETLPAKLDLILNELHLRDRVKDETVAIKMHTGNNMVYSTIHPVFVRRVVQAVKDGGGKPFVVDVNWDAAGAEQRGYASEVLGCPVYPAAGPDEKYFYEHERPYKNIQKWKVAGLIQDFDLPDQLRPRQGTPQLRLRRGASRISPSAAWLEIPAAPCMMPCITIPTGSPRNAPINR